MENKYKPILLEQTGDITLFDEVIFMLIFWGMSVGMIIWAIFLLF